MFHYHFCIGKATRRHFAHHELTQDEIDCRLVYRIAIAQRLQSSPHLVDGMYITLQDLLLQRLRHFLDVLYLCHQKSIYYYLDNTPRNCYYHLKR